MESTKDAIQQVNVENVIDEIKPQVESIDYKTKQKKHRRKRGKTYKSQHIETQVDEVISNETPSSGHCAVKPVSNIPGMVSSDEVDGLIINKPKQTVDHDEISIKKQLYHGRQFREKVTRNNRHQNIYDMVSKCDDKGEKMSCGKNESFIQSRNQKRSCIQVGHVMEKKDWRPRQFDHKITFRNGSSYREETLPHFSQDGQVASHSWVNQALPDKASQNSASMRQFDKEDRNMLYSQPYYPRRTRNDSLGIPPLASSSMNSSEKLKMYAIASDAVHLDVNTSNQSSSFAQGTSLSQRSMSPRGTPLSKKSITPKGKQSSRTKKPNERKLFEQYWNKDEVSDALKKGLILKGSLRISPKNYEMAWVTVKEYKRDVVILGMQPRNRALDGDVVALQILPKENWKILHQEIKFNMDDNVNPASEKEIVKATKNGYRVNTLAEFEDTVEKLKDFHVTLEKENYVETTNTKFCTDTKEKSENFRVLLDKDICGKEDDKVTKTDSNLDKKSLKTPTKLKNEHEININNVPDQYIQRTAKVVYIIEPKHSRIACGHLRPMADPKDPDGLFSPIDCRLPRLRIARDDCPAGFFDRPQDFATTLMIARLTDWKREAPHDSFFAKGVFGRSLGEAGEIEPETESILAINEIDTSPFTQDVLDCLPKNLPWKIPQEELETRRDFRDSCVFTIDPSSARDLDDALHCIQLDDGFFEIGVHIADVSYFVKDDTALDKVASLRATSTYMVQKVIPMLPRLLCEKLCSLNPCEDRLTFSVVWKVNQSGVIHNEWIGKGIILSRAKLSYEHAQDMIGKPEKVWKEEEHPPLASGTSITEIADCVRNLNKIALQLRHRRFENGTLRLDKAKICFDLNCETGLPIGWHEYVQRDSNKLIEEFMLLANMAVAHRIYNAFPDKALLRCHPKPDARQLEEICALCKPLGVNFAHESSKGIQDTLNTFSPNSPEHLVLSHLSMKPMKPAKYFSSATADGDPEEFKHYALSVPLYTHFTSPIRRYPDVIVHRLLAASLGVQDVPEFESENLQVIADRCNDRKLAAKKASEASVDLYLGAFVRDCGPLTEDGIVVSVMHESLDVLVLHFGIIKRVYFKFCDEVKSFDFQEGHKDRPAKVVVAWKGPNEERNTDNKRENDKQEKRRKGKNDGHTVSFTIFTPVKILLKTEEDSSKNKSGLKFSGELLPNCIDK